MKLWNWMKEYLPLFLRSVVVASAVLAILVFAFGISGVLSLSSAARGIVDGAYVLTLVAVVIYAYFSYQIAKAKWLPIMCGQLQQDSTDPENHLFLYLLNRGTVHAYCWCKMVAVANNVTIQLDGFYNEHHAAYVQPKYHVRGHFYIDDLLKQGGLTREMVIKKAEEETLDTAKIKITVTLSFVQADKGNVQPDKSNTQPGIGYLYWNQPLKYYFDIKKNQLVYDI